MWCHTKKKKEHIVRAAKCKSLREKKTVKRELYVEKKIERREQSVAAFEKDNYGMFGKCFFSLFFVFKNNFLFLRLKNLFGNQNGQKTKTILKTQFVKETKNMQNAVFSF